MDTVHSYWEWGSSLARMRRAFETSRVTEYQNWLRRVFDHPVVEPEWYWAEDADTAEPDALTSVEYLYSLHSASWWRRHWQRTGILDIAVADSLPDGWRFWRDWLKLVAPTNEQEIGALEADAGRHFGYVRVVGRRRAEARMFDLLMSVPVEYSKQPLLRGSK